MKKLLSSLAVVTLIGVTSISVVTCGGERPSPVEKTDLNTVIIKKELGIIYIGQLDKPNKSEILKAIKDKNKEAIDLTEDDFDIKSFIDTTKIIINGKGTYKNEVSLSCTITNFKKISNWEDNNGAVHALVNINGVLYVGTSIFGKGNLYKSNSDGKFELMNNWKQDNGAVWALTNINGVLYVGTSTANKKGNLYKINTNDINAKIEPVSTWNNTNGEVSSLTNVDSTLYVGITNNNGEGKIYKSKTDKSFGLMLGWESTNGAVWSLTNINDTIYIGTITSVNKGNLYITEKK
ncbi:MAG: hypothetical protein H9Q65_01655 [Spiroplasma ixodetis]|nr:hypothetical protein [Spiroplasma ixodetis]MBP1527951.1 hypothetical protein [Spiroplasma ixodetis]